MAAAGVDYHVGREATVRLRREVERRADRRAAPSAPLRRAEAADQSRTSCRRSEERCAAADQHRKPPERTARATEECRRTATASASPTIPDNRIPFAKPDGYDPTQYELLLRVYEAGWRETFDKFDPVPNRKTDSNNHGPFSTDNIGLSYDYPEASYERRREILKEHETYQKGWLYFIANDPRVPKDVQERMRQWGLPKDEFTDNGGWPHQIYVREARRMVGAFVMTEHELMKRRPTPASVGMGSYTHRLAQRAALHHARRTCAERGGHRRPAHRAVRDRLRRARAEARPGRQPARARLRLELAHRVRLDPHGAGVHDARRNPPRPPRRSPSTAASPCRTSPTPSCGSVCSRMARCSSTRRQRNSSVTSTFICAERRRGFDASEHFARAETA